MKPNAGKFHQHLKHVGAALHPAKITRRLETRKLIQDFADSHGLVYFGSVDHRSDDHRLVRGMTTSAHQEDKDYCIGSYNGYDIVFTRRIVKSSSDKVLHNWLIIQIDLKTQHEMPHMLIGPHIGANGHYDRITSALPALQPIVLGSFGVIDRSFTSSYTVYTKPARGIDAQRIVSPEIAGLIGQHFPPLAIEIWDGCTFIYSTEKHPSDKLLDVMLQNGVWLAQQIDARADQLREETQSIT